MLPLHRNRTATESSNDHPRRLEQDRTRAKAPTAVNGERGTWTESMIGPRASPAQTAIKHRRGGRHRQSRRQLHRPQQRGARRGRRRCAPLGRAGMILNHRARHGPSRMVARPSYGTSKEFTIFGTFKRVLGGWAGGGGRIRCRGSLRMAGALTENPRAGRIDTRCGRGNSRTDVFGGAKCPTRKNQRRETER